MPIAFVFITTEPSSMPAVLKQVREVKGVVEAEMVYGVYDIVAKVNGETMDQLKQIVIEPIPKNGRYHLKSAVVYPIKIALYRALRQGNHIRPTASA